MKAMILAAGLGTRLRPLTEDRPKALVEINGRTLLEIALARLRKFGVGEVIINVHHFADMIVAYLQANGNFGMRIEVSREGVLLDTGGGLKKAAHFFTGNSVDKSVADSSGPRIRPRPVRSQSREGAKPATPRSHRAPIHACETRSSPAPRTWPDSRRRR